MTVTAMSDSMRAVHPRNGSHKRSRCEIHPAAPWIDYDQFNRVRNGIEAELCIAVCAGCKEEGLPFKNYQFELNFIREEENVGAVRIFPSILDGQVWIATKNLDHHFFQVVEWRGFDLLLDQTLNRMLLELSDEIGAKYPRNEPEVSGLS